MAKAKKHAVLSASGSHIWLNCPPSVKLSEGLPDTTSAYAEEGTIAHLLAETILAHRFGRTTDGAYRKHLDGIRKNEYYSEEMYRYIWDYANWVEEIYEGIRSADKELLTEQKLDFSAWVPDGFGTGDVLIIADGTLTVIDLKYGKGVPVSAVENPQLMLYGLGAYDAFSLSNDIATIRLIINQPRLDSISEYEIAVEDLLKWGEEIVKPAAALALEGKGEQKAGDHCRFCKVKAKCRKRLEAVMELEGMSSTDPRLLSDDEIAHMLGRAEAVKAWVEDAKAYALAEALEGKTFPGWKLVEGRSVRKFSDLKAVESRLTAAGFDKAVIYKDPELLGISAMEKVVGGKKKLETICEGLIVKPPGAPTLVPESDKRPAINDASVYDDGYKED